MDQAIEISAATFPYAFADMEAERKRNRSIFRVFLESENSGVKWNVEYLRAWAIKHNDRALLDAIL